MSWIINLLLLLLALFAASSTRARAAEQEITVEALQFFEKIIRPVLVEHCCECHSGQANKVEGGLLLDSRGALLKGGSSGPALVPGSPEKSLLFKVLQCSEALPNADPKHRLPAPLIADLESWVKMGAPDPRTGPPSSGIAKSDKVDFEEAKKFWCFQPVQDHRTPAVNNKNWPITDIDRFVLAKLEERKLSPGSRADKRTLLRRATFDLIGLPPTPAEMEDFLEDDSSDAFAKVVDRLLASPHYGERWGRHWLDVVRYADSAGDSADYPVPQAYLYRNYVINAFNQDKSYDQFIREQLAGDLLPHTTEAQKKEQLIATGFIAISRRFGVSPEMHLTIEDTIDTTGRALLGLSVSCARCHDHKSDPISTKDYYGLYGIFSSTRYPFPGSENNKRQKDFVPLVPKEQVEALRKPFEEKLEAIETELIALRAEVRQNRTAGGLRTLNDIRKAAADAQKRRDAILDEIPDYPDAYAVAEGTTGNARIQGRGDPGQQGEEVPRGFLQILGGQQLSKEAKTSGRRELADWMVDPKNPLTARVMVNRIWQHHFGKGLVQTPNDFGRQGKAPIHPELLDHLAARFVESGWSVKSLHRTIMLSQTYQLSSGGSPENAKVDPNNEWLWKFNRQRLDAEVIRDALLFVSGDLDSKMGGAHPFPPETKWTFTQHSQFNAVYESKKRSVYVMQQRIKKHPFFATFDGPDANASTGERLVTTTPLQALYLMNDRFVHEQAERFASRLGSLKLSDSQCIDLAYQLALTRSPMKEELKETVAYLKAYRAKARGVATTSEGQSTAELNSLARVLFSSNEFFFVD